MNETENPNISEKEIEEHLAKLKPAIESVPEKSRNRFLNILRGLGKASLYLIDSFAVGMYMGGKMRFEAKTLEEAEDAAAREFDPKIIEKLGLEKKKRF